MIGLSYSIGDPAGRGIAEYLVESLKPDKSSECINAITCYKGASFLMAGL